MSNVPFNNLTKQWAPYKETILSSISDSIDNSNFVGGHHIKRAEIELSSFIRRHTSTDLYFSSVLCSSGTAALTAILKALQLPEGARVGIQSNTFIATVFATIHAGYEPVLVHDWYDVVNTTNDEHSLDVVIPVHMFGYVDHKLMTKIKEWCDWQGVVLIEDACQAIGTKNACSYGIASAFSFYPGKNLGAWGQAGAVVTTSDHIKDYVKSYIDQGQTSKGRCGIVGDNLRCDPIQAIVINEGLKHIDSWNDSRRRIAARYLDILRTINTQIKDHFGVGMMHPTVGHQQLNDSNWHIFQLQLEEAAYDMLVKEFNKSGIQYGHHYPVQIWKQTPFTDIETIGGWSSYGLNQRKSNNISLPIFPEMTKEETDFVINSLINTANEFLRTFRTDKQKVKINYIVGDDTIH